jgi:hypothetical protein
MAELSDFMSLPADLRAQQALGALGGYAHQIYATAIAWLRLDQGGVLYVEVAEDYATLVCGEVHLVQVRRTRAPISLRTKGVQQVIANLWRMARDNPERSVRSTYLTTSSSARERGSPLPKGVNGLEAWGQAATDAEVRQLAALLRGTSLPLDLRAWLGAASPQKVRERLLSRIIWRLESADTATLKAVFGDLMAARGAVLGLLDAEAERAATAVLLKLLEIASSPGQRALTDRDLNRLIQDTNFVMVPAEGQRAARTADLGYAPPLSDRTRDDPAGRLFFFGAADRTEFIGRGDERDALLEWARRGVDFSWTLLTGAGGMGKSRLALEICQALAAEGWDTGFLSPGSALVAAERFATFRPTQPTLIVIDYVSLSAEWAGEIARTLLDAATVKPFDASVRLLLIERTGPSSPWWEVFNGQHVQRLMGRSARLSAGGFLELNGLKDGEVWRLFESVAPSANPRNRRRILASLAKIDPNRTPLFTSLAAEATRAGRKIWQFDRSALLNDIFLRERARWRAIARDESELQRHELGASLSTMVGGVDLSTARDLVGAETFPFASPRFNPRLANAIAGAPPSIHQMVAIEPDILGEWFVLRHLQAEHGLDDRPALLREAADRFAAFSPQYRWAYAGFRTRLAQDFAPDAPDTGLFDPPPADAHPDLIASWMSVLANTLEHLQPALPTGRIEAIHDEVIVAADRWLKEKVVQTSATAFLGVYAALKVDQGDVERAIDLLDRLAGLPGAPEFVEPALELCRASYWIGRALAERGEGLAAFAIVERLRTQGEAFRFVEGANWRDMLRYGVMLALAMRRAFMARQEREAVQSIDRILWGPASEGREDLAEISAEALATSAVDEQLMEWEDVLNELERRSRERRDDPEIAVWTARALLYSTRGNRRDEDEFVERVRRLSRWIMPRQHDEEICNVFDEAVDEGLLDNWGELGRVPVGCLRDIWLGAHQAVKDSGRDPEKSLFVKRRLEAFRKALEASEDPTSLQPILDGATDFTWPDLKIRFPSNPRTGA